MAIEYLRGGIFLFVGDEGHFDSLVSRGYYSPVPDHEIPYDLRLEIQDRLDARGVKGSSARQSTGTNEAGKNCWAPNKPCGKACRVNCKSGSGTVGAKPKKAATKKMVSEALAKKKGAASQSARTGPMSQKEADRELRRMVLGRKPSPQGGPEPKASYSTKIAKKDYDAEEKAYIADVRAGKYGHGKDSKAYADHYERMDPKGRKSAFGNAVTQRILDRRKASAEKKNLPKLLKHHDITPEEHMAGVNAVHAQLLGTSLGSQEGFSKMSDAQKMARFGTRGAQRVVAMRERIQEDKSYAKGASEKRAKLLEQAKGAGFSPQDILGKVSEIIKEGGYDTPSSKNSALAMYGEQALAMLSEGKKGGANAKKAKAPKAAARTKKPAKAEDPSVAAKTKALSRAQEMGMSEEQLLGAMKEWFDQGNAGPGRGMPGNPDAAIAKYGDIVLSAIKWEQAKKRGTGNASKSKTRKAKAPSRQKQLEAQLAADPFFADIMRRRRDSRYDSFDFIPYYATTGLPTLVDPFGAFR